MTRRQIEIEIESHYQSIAALEKQLRQLPTQTSIPIDDYSHDVVGGPFHLKGIPVGVPGGVTTRTYAVSLPWWARRIRKAAEAVASWTRRFETHTRIG